MRSATARIMMMVLLLAGLALALPGQSAVARHGSPAAVAFVNGDRGPPHRIVVVQGNHRFAGHRVHRFGARAFHPVQRHSRHAFHGSKRHATGKVATRAFQRSAAHHAGFHSGRVFHSGRGFHKPPHHAHARHGFKGPRIIVVEPTGTHRVGSHGVVVVRGGGVHRLTVGQAPGTLGGSKLIVLPSSPHFKHVVVGK